jgi:DNA-binding response OmpR family regulator
MPFRDESVQGEATPQRPEDEIVQTDDVSPSVGSGFSSAPTMRDSSAFMAILRQSPILFETAGVGQLGELWREVVNRALGVIPLQIAPCDLGDLLMNILPRWKTVAPRHTLELALPGDVPPSYADGEWAARAFSLLIDYAIRATPQGGSVRVSVRPAEDGVVTQVRHFGVAPDDATLERILEPSGGAVGGAPLGTGLELPLARLILEAHGGRLRVERPAAGEGLALGAWWPAHEPSERPLLSERLLLEELSATSSAEPGRADRVARPHGATTARAERPPALDRERAVILIVEEDARMARYLKANLDASGYTCAVARGPEDAARAMDLNAPDVIILDGGLAGMGNQALLQEILARAGCPVVVLGRAHSPLACARALDAGASDWIARPFNTEELLARVRATLRTRQVSESAQSEMAIGELRFDAGGRSVWRSGKLIPLSKTELRLLRALAARPGAVLSHAALLERVWGPAYHDATDFLWVYIRRLRKKIEADPSAPRYILTVPGIGYRLAHHDEITNS